MSNATTALDPVRDPRWSATCVEDAGGQVVGGLPVARIRSVLTGMRMVADMDNEGLRSFKLAWGAEERVLAYSKLASAGTRSSSGASAGSAPLRFVIRRSPPLVGQMVGSLLYRHVG